MKYTEMDAEKERGREMGIEILDNPDELLICY
jgi:hypothetical protein